MQHLEGTQSQSTHEYTPNIYKWSTNAIWDMVSDEKLDYGLKHGAIVVSDHSSSKIVLSSDSNSTVPDHP